MYSQIRYLVLIILLISVSGPIQGETGLAEIQEMEIKNIINQNFASVVIPIAEDNGVLLQPFYWDMPDRGTHWRMLNDHLDMFVEDGFDSMWLPPPSKTREGYPATGGYEPYDFYDLGAYDQKGRVRTLFGTQQELVDLIANANAENIGIIADIVINHRMGGGSEFNPFTGINTDTNFMDVASGKLRMNYTHFHPNDVSDSDGFVYGAFPDISHAVPEVRKMMIDWALWLQDEIGFDGFRFDSAQGFDATMIRDWMQAVRSSEVQGADQTFGVSEYWMFSPDVGVVLNHLNAANDTTRAMDFALLEHMKIMMNADGGFDMRDLEGIGIMGTDPSKAVTFTQNHDTYRDKFDAREDRRHLGYAYTLTHPGYPSVFWMDYVDMNLRNHIRHLVNIHHAHAFGELTVLHTDDDLYIAQRAGDDTHDGLIVALNDNWESRKTATIQTKWANIMLYDLLNETEFIETDAEGKAFVSIPASGYIIYSPDNSLADTLEMEIPQIKSDYPFALQTESIVVDGELDRAWGIPAAIDGEGSLNPTDLTNLYLAQDEENLYIGFAYENLYNWTGGEVNYGIAIDTHEGGSNFDPEHENIKFGGNANLPDRFYYLNTDFSDVNHYERKINEIHAYEFEGSWKGTTSDLNVASHPMLGMIEVQIPLDELAYNNELSKISVKIVSNIEGTDTVQDSVPSDITIDPEAESWLFMGDGIIVSYTPVVTSESILTDTENVSETTDSSFLGWLIPIWLIPLNRKVRSRNL